ncbi:MAG: hypothetical protein WBV21_08045 [Desulfobacterales bacterium]|jgi:hypothetical protein
MLARLDVEKASCQHETLAQAYSQVDVKVFYVEPGEASLPNQMFGFRFDVHAAGGRRPRSGREKSAGAPGDWRNWVCRS